MRHHVGAAQAVCLKREIPNHPEESRSTSTGRGQVQHHVRSTRQVHPLPIYRWRALTVPEEPTIMAERIKIEQHSFGGLIWIGGWLFSIGFLHLTFWQGVLAVVIWPYYIGTMASGILK
jgi:hypothetical protein